MNKTHRITKTIISFVIAAALALIGTVPSFAEESGYDGADKAPKTTGTSVILMDAGSGTILYEKNAYKKRDPASMTKILNLLVCLDVLDFDEEVTVETHTTGQGTGINLQKGEKITIRDLAYAMMLGSANDAAEYLGYLAGGGDIDAFCDMMDAKAKELGALDTDYKNPNGLNPDKVNNVTTAYDLAVVAREAMKDPPSPHNDHTDAAHARRPLIRRLEINCRKVPHTSRKDTNSINQSEQPGRGLLRKRLKALEG